MLGNGGNGREIVSMTDREKMRRKAPLRQVEAYWHGLCDTNAVPLRSQVDPRGMEDALENAFLMERIAPSMAKIRVAGSHLSDLMGMQIAGMPLSSLIAPSERERFGQAISHLFGDPAIIKIELRAEGGFGKPEMEASMVLMPLKSDFGDLSRALGAMVSHGRIGRTPRRFLIDSVEITPIEDTHRNPGILSRKPIDLPAKPKARAFEEKQTPFKPSTVPTPATVTELPAKATRGHLRLIVSND